MKNLISKRREGEHSHKIENEPENLKYKKKIKYDVYTEIWEFDTKEEWLQILELTCNDNQEVVYTDYDDLNTYHIIDINDYDSGLRNIIKNDTYFDKLLELDEEEDIFINLPSEVKAILAKFGDYRAIIPEDV